MKTTSRVAIGARNRRTKSRELHFEVLERREVLSSFTFLDFSDPAGISFNGEAITAGNVLQLTETRTGAAWFTQEKSLVVGGFDTTFEFQMTPQNGPGTGRDGFAFVIQNSSPVELRGWGGDLGYHTMPNCLAIEFDTFENPEFADVNADHISVHSNGEAANNAHESYALASYSLQGAVLDDSQSHIARITYAPGSLSIFLDDLVTPVLTVSVDLATTLNLDLGRAWVGFTGFSAGLGTGSAGPVTQQFHNWVFQSNEQIILADSPSILEGVASSIIPLTFTIHRMGSQSGDLVVNWETENGTAQSGADYVAASGQVYFQDGETQKSVHVLVNGDDLAEDHEIFKLLPSASNYTGIIGKGTIQNDDVTLSIADDGVLESEVGYRIIDSFVAAHDGGLTHGRGAAFGPDGNFYVGHMGFGGVLRFNGQTGEFLDLFADARNHTDQVTQVLFHDGNLFVAAAPNVLRFDGATGTPLPASGKSGSLFATLSEQGVEIGSHAIAFGPDGNLYVTSQWTNQILQYDGSSGDFLAFYVSAGSGGLDRPNALAFAPNGEMYVGSSGSDAVHRYEGPNGSNPGAFIDVFITSGSGGLNWIPSGGISFRPDGDVYVSSRDSSSVLRFNGTTGAFVETVVASGEGGLTTAGGHTFDTAGLLYVNSQNTHEVLRYGPASLSVLTVMLSHPSAVPVTVQYATQNGSASAGSDYTSLSGVLTFAPGHTALSVLVSTSDDSTYEGNESFFVNLSSPSAGATIVDGQGVATIQDNDPQPTKFYVVNDATTNVTYEYGASGAAIENYSLNSGNAAPRGAASVAAGDKVWVVDNNRTVYVYNPSGGLLGSWTAGSIATNGQSTGIATNGVDVWIVDAKSDKVFKYTGAATRLSGSQNAASSFSLNTGNKDASDIVTDGTHLWVVNNSSTDKVFKYTVAGSLVGSWTISTSGVSSPTGITLDPSNPSHLWIVDSGTDRVYQYDNAVGNIGGSQAALTSFALAAGNSNPQGIADPPPAGQASSPTGSLVDSVLANEMIDDELVMGVAAMQPSADDYDAALFSIMAEFEQAWMRPKRKAAILLA